MSLVNIALGLLALAIVGFGLLLAVSAVRMRIRRRRHVGSYRAQYRIGDAAATVLADEFESIVDARAALVRVLGADPDLPGERRGWILAARADGTWDVADEVHAL